MCNFDAIATLAQEFIQLIGDENAAMLAAGAAHANDQLGLALIDILGPRASNTGRFEDSGR